MHSTSMCAAAWRTDDTFAAVCLRLLPASAACSASTLCTGNRRRSFFPYAFFFRFRHRRNAPDFDAGLGRWRESLQILAGQPLNAHPRLVRWISRVSCTDANAPATTTPPASQLCNHDGKTNWAVDQTAPSSCRPSNSPPRNPFILRLRPMAARVVYTVDRR